jgi:hypothetical protein
MSKIQRTFKHPEYTEISTMERDMSGLFKVLGMKVNRYKRGLIVNTKTHSYQLEINNGNKNSQL